MPPIWMIIDPNPMCFGDFPLPRSRCSSLRASPSPRHHLSFAALQSSGLHSCRHQAILLTHTKDFPPPPPNLAQQTGSVVISVPSGAVQNGWEHRFDPKRIPPAADPFAPRLQSHSCCTRFNVGHEDVYSLFMRVSFRAKPRTF